MNRLRFQTFGREIALCQLGTVMTDPDFRGRGLAGRLMREVLSRLPEDVYLFANDSVLDFYPRFGFRKGTERQCVRAVEPAKAQAARTFDPMRPENRVRLERLLRLPRPGEALSLLDNPQLYLFYLLGPMSRCLYELPERAGLAVAGRQCRLPLAAAGSAVPTATCCRRFYRRPLAAINWSGQCLRIRRLPCGLPGGHCPPRG